MGDNLLGRSVNVLRVLHIGKILEHFLAPFAQLMRVDAVQDRLVGLIGILALESAEELFEFVDIGRRGRRLVTGNAGQKRAKKSLDGLRLSLFDSIFRRHF